MARRKKPELAFQALLAEHQFVSSLITMYREFQMRAVGFAMILYAAVLGLIGSAIGASGGSHLDRVVSYATELICFPAALVILVFSVMEVRILRASLFLSKRTSPTIDHLLKEPSTDDTDLLLTWERSPGIFLSPGLRTLSSSTMFIVAIAAPAASATLWHLRKAESLGWGSWETWPWLDLLGLMVLSASAALAGLISSAHEGRLPTIPKPRFLRRALQAPKEMPEPA